MYTRYILVGGLASLGMATLLQGQQVRQGGAPLETARPSVGAPRQVPRTHTSFSVHASPSSQLSPSEAPSQSPGVCGTHAPSGAQRWPSGHCTALPTQTPAVQASPLVHGSPSLHPVPFSLVTGPEQAPVWGWQMPES